MHSEDASPSFRTLFVGYLVMYGRVPDARDYKACQSPHSEMVGRISLARDSNPGPFDPESDALTVRPLAILAQQWFFPSLESTQQHFAIYATETENYFLSNN